jgi:chromosomal replication initiator protein DnaA
MLGWRKEKEPQTPAAGQPRQNQPTGPLPAAPKPIQSATGPLTESQQAALLHPRNRLGAILVEEGYISVGQLEEALKKKDAEGGFLGQALIELRYIDQSTLINFLVKQCKIPHISLADYVVSDNLLEYLPKEICMKYNCLPIDKLGRILTVAMVDPFDTEAIEAITRALPDVRIKPILCNWMDFNALASRILGKAKQAPKEATAGSFGLSDSKPKVKPSTEVREQPKPSAQVSSTVQVQHATPSDTSGSPLPLSDSGILQMPEGWSTNLNGMIKGGIREAVQEAFTGVAAEMRASDSGTRSPVPQEFATVIQETVRSAMVEMSQSLGHQFAVAAVAQQEASAQRAQAAGHSAQPALDGTALQQLAAALGDGVKTAMHDAVRDISRQMSNANTTSQLHAPQGISMDEIAVVVQQGVSGALKEALGEIATSLKAGTKNGASASNDQIAELAEAASQAVRAAEAAIEAARTVQATQAAQQEIDEERRGRFRSVKPMGSGDDVAPKPKKQSGDERVKDALESNNTIAAYTFDGYFVSKNNEFTCNVCKAIAANPGSEYNPLFIYGDVGIGKTHLVNAVGNTILTKKQDTRVGYVSAGLFARRLMESVSERQSDAFRENYCHWDVLLLDDIQFLGYEVAAQEELFHIFNALYQEGRQIIIVADNPPDRLGKLEKRLVSRFTAGIVAKLEAPDFKTRAEILGHYSRKQGAKLSPEVLSIVATRIPNDIRKMCGALRKVIAFGKLVGQDITCDLAYEVLSHLDANEAA